LKFRLKVSKQAERFLDRHSEAFAYKFERAFMQICENPFRATGLDIKKLKGLKQDFRLRIGQYRMLYTTVNDIVYVYRIDTRGDVYKGKR